MRISKEVKSLGRGLVALALLAVATPVLAAPAAPARAVKSAPLTEAKAIELVRTQLHRYPKVRALLGRIKHVYAFDPAEDGYWVGILENRGTHVTRLWTFKLVPDAKLKTGYRLEAYDVLTDSTVPFETFLKENQLK